ncbi:SRPBCC family protein [Streptomyces celluloflavus]|uniref:hypothetical protein n=1 Tax=Streptomyces celluloflavus TaxID=58344 RepID=UPI003693113B
MGTPDGATHTTRSVRICFPGERVVCEQTTLPARLTARTREWRVCTTPDGVEVVSRHTVVIDAGALAGVLGEEATVAGARVLVRDALGANGRITPERAGHFAENRGADASPVRPPAGPAGNGARTPGFRTCGRPGPAVAGSGRLPGAQAVARLPV